MKRLDDYVFVLDVDGVITDGKFWYNKDGKYLKCFGADDFDILKELNKYMHVNFITADKKGFPITQKRIEEEMGFELDIVSNLPKKRWNWIKTRYPNKRIIFMGDGWADAYSLERCWYGFTTNSALDFVKNSARYVLSRDGGNRAVAEACLMIFKREEIDWMENLGDED